MEECKLCNKQFKNLLCLSNHLKIHNITRQLYYDLFLKKSTNEGKCKICGKPTRFKSITEGYVDLCTSINCRALQISNTKKQWSIEQKTQFIKRKRNTNIKKYKTDCPANYLGGIKSKQTKFQKYGDEHYVNKEKMMSTKKQRYNSLSINTWVSRKNNIKEFEIENDCTAYSDLVDKYGQGWLVLNIPKIYSNKQNCFIENKYIPIIEQYSKENHTNSFSKAEKDICAELKNLGLEIIENSKKVIPPYELDIYIPSLNIAIEYNGIRWHSIELDTPKDYHLMKSKMCRDKNIRLIHIYEFEDFNKQLNLLYDLIVNKIDNYPKNDFNKNNLGLDIPEPEIIFKNEKYCVYGAGKLL